MTLLGELSLWVALLLTAWSAAVAVAGATTRRAALVESGKRAAYAVPVFVGLAALALWTALLGSDFSLAYAASVTAANLPPAYKLSALWAAPPGARLVWALVLSILSAAVAHAGRRRAAQLAPVASAVLSALAFGALLAVCVGASPFARLEWLPPDGRGLDPRLQHPGAALLAPLLATGYGTAAVPFAIVNSALLARRSDAEWIGAAQSWTVVSWLFLTLGVVTGIWLAHADRALGTSSVWNAPAAAAALPWLGSAALLHTARADAASGTLRLRSIALAQVTAVSSLAAALFTLSGPAVATGIGRSPDAVVAAALVVGALAASAFLVLTRRVDLPSASQAAGTPTRVPDARPGGHVAHAGVVLLAIALGLLALARRYDATLRPGERLEARDPYGARWAFVSQGVSSDQVGNRDVTVVALEARRDGARVGYVRGERSRYFDGRGAPLGAPVSDVGRLASLRQDVDVLLLAAAADERADVRVAFVPMAWLMWAGAALMAGGALLTLGRTTAGAPVSR